MANPDFSSLRSPSVDPSTYFNGLREAGFGVTAGSEVINVAVPDSRAFFRANVWENDSRVVSFAIRTIRLDGKREALFEQYRASDMARQAIRYFDQFGTLHSLAFDWSPPKTDKPIDRSDNFSKYIEERDRLSQVRPYEAAKVAAALETWTLREIAGPNGFYRLSSVSENGDRTRPKMVSGLVSR